jgi:hypothetical protein
LSRRSLSKKGSTVRRFARYYMGAPDYWQKGPPLPVLRLLGPILAVLVVPLVSPWLSTDPDRAARQPRHPRRGTVVSCRSVGGGHACRVRGDPAARRRPHELVVGTPSCPRPLCTRAVRSPVAVPMHTPRQFHLRRRPAGSQSSTRGSSCPTPPAATSPTERPACPSGRGGLLRRPRQRHLDRRAVGPRRHHDARRRAREAEPRPAGGQRPTCSRVERRRHHPVGSHPGQRGERPAIGSRGQADGALVYAGGPGLNITDLARLLTRAGAVRAVELDVVTDWVSLCTHQPSTASGPAGPASGADLLPKMVGTPGRYFESWWARGSITMPSSVSPCRANHRWSGSGLAGVSEIGRWRSWAATRYDPIPRRLSREH